MLLNIDQRQFKNRHNVFTLGIPHQDHSRLRQLNLFLVQWLWRYLASEVARQDGDLRSTRCQQANHRRRKHHQRPQENSA